MGFFRQVYWSGLPFPPPGDLANSRMEPVSPASPALHMDYLPLNHLGSPFYSTVGVNNAVISRASTGYWAGAPLCSIAITALSGAGSAPQLLEYKP